MENTTHGASKNAARREVVFDLETTRRMLPLVQRIVADILEKQKQVTELLPLEERLRRQRRSLVWPERFRRYQIQEDLAAAEQNLQTARAELVSLGVVLLEGQVGRVGFPTIVNGQPAFFSWRPGEDTINFWHFADQTARRPIPASWVKPASLDFSTKK
jgi:hypothetical protein